MVLGSNLAADKETSGIDTACGRTFASFLHWAPRGGRCRDWRVPKRAHAKKSECVCERTRESELGDTVGMCSSPGCDCDERPVDVTDCAAARINPVRCDFTVRQALRFGGTEESDG